MILKLKKHKQIIISLLLIIALAAPLAVLAKSQFIPDNCLTDKAEDCGLRDLVLLFVNFYSFFLKYLGSLALLLFVIGGIMFMTSGGNQEKVTKAKQILVGTTIGILIVMSSYLAISFIQDKIGLKSDYQIQQKK